MPKRISFLALRDAVIVGAGSFIFGLIALYGVRLGTAYRNGLTATGIVVGFEMTEDAKFPIIEFRDVNGSTHQLRSTTGVGRVKTLEDFSQGVTVSYHPDQPEKARHVVKPSYLLPGVVFSGSIVAFAKAIYLAAT